MFDTTPYEEKMNHVLEHLEERLGKIRTGRLTRVCLMALWLRRMALVCRSTKWLT